MLREQMVYGAQKTGAQNFLSTTFVPIRGESDEKQKV